MLRRKAAEVERVAATVPGIVDLQTEKQVLIPQLHVRLDRQRAAQYGVMVGEVAEYIEMAMNGKVITQVLDGQKSFDVVLRLTDEARNNIEAIKTLPIDVDKGKLLPLGPLRRYPGEPGTEHHRERERGTTYRHLGQRRRARSGQCRRGFARPSGQAGGAPGWLFHGLWRAI